MNRYFQITTDNGDPATIAELSDSAARTRADKGPHWFVLRTGPDAAHPVGIHACELTFGQQAWLEAFRLATPGCALPADWNDDYPTAEAEAGKQMAGDGAGAPLRYGHPRSARPSGAGEYIKALPA